MYEPITIKNILGKGFTLAEVLITLTILGVVATISMSTLIRHYQRTVTIVKVKKYYSKLTNAYEMYKTVNPDGLCFNDSTSVFNALIRPNFKISYDAGLDRQKQLEILPTAKYKHLNGNEWTTLAQTSWYSAKLNDGSVVTSRLSHSCDSLKSRDYDDYINISFDINGKNGPNTYGKDLFNFQITANYGVPTGVTTRDSYVWLSNPVQFSQENIAKNCIKSSSTGTSCAGWIILRGNMNYLDCPDNIDESTGKCK